MGALWLKVVRQAVIGAVLIFSSLWMIFYAGLLKKSFVERQANPSSKSWYSRHADRHWPAIQWLGNEHPVIWHIAPLFPPDELTGRAPFTWSSVPANWLLLCWVVICYGGVWSLGSADHLLTLIGEVSREEKKEKLRRTMRGESPGGERSETSIHVLTEIQVQAAETGKWKSLTGAIVTSCIGAVLAQVIKVWLGLEKS